MAWSDTDLQRLKDDCALNPCSRQKYMHELKWSQMKYCTIYTTHTEHTGTRHDLSLSLSHSTNKRHAVHGVAGAYA